ncbi:protein LSM12-like [Oppia nitens]|uniref:protein LSM12-like n=1 Tax=Oppia nitens TaxID=1686743 RepID=UPI0023DB72DF|nr:protein LSM12-like [Oppia nitens]
MSISDNNNNTNNNELMFTAGSRVSCLTISDEMFTGIVMAYDYRYRILTIKSVSDDGLNRHCNMTFVNLDNVKQVTILSAVKPEMAATSNLLPLMTDCIQYRLNQAINDRRNVHKAFVSGISDFGIQLFLYFYKIFDKSGVNLADKDIVVNGMVKIRPPYQLKDCSNMTCEPYIETTALRYVRKHLNNFLSKH